MAAIFDTENNECSQDDYIAPVFGVIDDSGVSKYELRVQLTICSQYIILLSFKFSL